MKKKITQHNRGLKMFVWKYTILSDAGTITTRNTEYAEKKSRLGYPVFCERENNVYKFYH